MSIPYPWLDRLLDRGWLRVLTRAEMSVLLAMGRYLNWQTRETWVHTDKLVEVTGLAPSTVYAGLHGLRKHDLLSTKVEPRASRRIARTYDVEVHTLCPVEQIPIPQSQAQSANLEHGQSAKPESNSLSENGEIPLQDRRFSPRSGQIDQGSSVVLIRAKELLRSVNGGNDVKQAWEHDRVERLLADARSQGIPLDGHFLKGAVILTGWTEEQLQSMASQPSADAGEGTPR